MGTPEKARDFAEQHFGDGDTELPRDNEYVVKISGLGIETQTVFGPIEGKYHAMYIKDRLAGAVGHVGVSFSIENTESRF